MKKPAVTADRTPDGRFLPGNRVGHMPRRVQNELVRQAIEPKRQELLDAMFRHAGGADIPSAVRACIWLLERLTGGAEIGVETNVPHIPGLAEAKTPGAKASLDFHAPVFG